MNRVERESRQRSGMLDGLRRQTAADSCQLSSGRASLLIRPSRRVIRDEADDARSLQFVPLREDEDAALHLLLGELPRSPCAPLITLGILSIPSASSAPLPPRPVPIGADLCDA